MDATLHAENDRWYGHLVQRRPFFARGTWNFISETCTIDGSVQIEFERSYADEVASVECISEGTNGNTARSHVDLCFESLASTGRKRALDCPIATCTAEELAALPGKVLRRG